MAATKKIKIPFSKYISITACLLLTGASLINQYDFYVAIAGVTKAYGASVIVEFTRIYTLYMAITKNKKGLAWTAYFLLAAWCMFANSIAITNTEYQEESQLDINLIEKYQVLKGEAVAKIKLDIAREEKESRQNSGILGAQPNNARIREIQKVRKSNISRFQREINGILNFRGKNNAELLAKCREVAARYGLRFKYDKTYTDNGERAPTSILWIPEKTQQIAANLFFILLIEIGIFTTAIYAKRNGQVDIKKSQVDIKLISRNDTTEKDIIKKHQEYIKHPLYSDFLDGKTTADYAPGENRKAMKIIRKFYRQNPELLKKR